MRKIKKWKISTAIASAACGVFALCGVVALKNNDQCLPVKAEATVTNTLADYYVVGDSLTFTNSELFYQGETYPATVYVTYPNGKRVMTNNVALNESGTYKIVYKYISEQLYLEEVKEVFVSSELFEVSSNKSTAVYTDFPSSFSDKGIVVSLASGDTFRYNKILDLSETKQSDKILQFFHNPNVPGAIDAARVEFTLTDIYDPNNYVTIIAKILGDGMYMTVNATNQPATGTTPCKEDTVTSEKKVIWRNQYYILQSANRYGTWFGYQFNGIPSSGRGIGSECIEFSTDGSAFFGANGKFLADLGDKDQFTNIWTGFTTGEVYLTIKGNGYEKSTMNFVLPSILDHDLSLKGMQDEQAPTIEVLWNENLPNAIVDKPYKVFDYKTVDDYTANVDCSVRVYYNYYSSTCSRIELINGTFTPKYTGVYTIEYMAKDAANNQTVTTVDVIARDDVTPMSISLSNHSTGFSVGDTVYVATPTVSSDYRQNEIKIEAILQGTDIKYGIDEHTLTFVPFYDGKYTIRYTATNYVETVVEEYELVIETTDKQYIFDEVVLPKYFIKNATYALPKLSFYDFVSGQPIEKTAKISVIEDKNTATVKEMQDNTYKVGASETVQVVYSTFDNNDKTVYEVPVVDVGFGVRLGLQMDKYFYSSDVSVEKKTDSLMFTASQSGTVGAEFINQLCAQEVIVSFSLLKSINQYKAIHFYVTDSVDENISVKFTYQWNGNQILFSVNDGKTSIIDSNAGEECNLEFEFDYENRLVSQFSGVDTKITNTINGEEFVGFTSNYVYLRFEIADATQNAGFRFFKINNQLFSDKKLDGIEPRIYAENIRGYKAVGEEVTIQASTAIDVLCPTVTYTMRVTDAKGNVVKDVFGNPLDETADTSVNHTIRLEKAGKYTIYLVATDASENFVPYTFTLTVTDITPPTLTLNNMITTASVGTNVRLADVSYDKDDVETMYVVVMGPDSSMTFVENGVLKVTKKGVYYVNYYATDSVGNVAMQSYTITVS